MPKSAAGQDTRKAALPSVALALVSCLAIFLHFKRNRTSWTSNISMSIARPTSSSVDPLTASVCPPGCLHATCGDPHCRARAACCGLCCHCCDGGHHRGRCCGCPHPSVQWRLPSEKRCPLPGLPAERHHRGCIPRPAPRSSSVPACCCVRHARPSAADCRHSALLAAAPGGHRCSPDGQPAHPRSACRKRMAAQRRSLIGHC